MNHSSFPEPGADNTPLNLDAYAPAEIGRRIEDVGVTKAHCPDLTMFILAVLAGAFISLGSNFFTVAITGSPFGFGPTRMLGGLAFCLGLILVVVAGAELFTGNNLLMMAWASRRISAFQLLRNWAIVYFGNFVGAVTTAYLVYESNQWQLGDQAVGATALKIAIAKVNLGFGEAFFRGVLCNALVCLAIWLCFSAHSTTDKILCVLFPVTAFAAAGFEHSVANMYFIPLGLMLKPHYPGVDTSRLGIAEFLLKNLLPVTLGNIVGGAGMVGIVYWFIYLRKKTT